MKLISPKLHGLIDYVLIIFLFASPVLFAMPKDVATYTYAIATGQLILTVITDYSYGMFRMVSLRLHQVIDVIISIGIIVAAFTLFEYDERSKPYYAGLGIFWLIITVFTDYSKKRDVIKAPIL
ncbi:hypothetical protein ACFQZI_17855 [Mucilaginibacter lutimaris]|uniref:SPW repeat-containing protein n=1 Tax=Mucilaginibacter lutimaris TaxID=931629 RepID=A0ABW2ZL69_9SPHI